MAKKPEQNKPIPPLENSKEIFDLAPETEEKEGFFHKVSETAHKIADVLTHGSNEPKDGDAPSQSESNEKDPTRVPGKMRKFL